MYQCSYCTGASAFTTCNAICVRCEKNPVHVCALCRKTTCKIPLACYMCYKREHVCLSLCRNGCIEKIKPTCACKKIRRFQVRKMNKNHNRFFWSCNQCSVFEWE